jgi:glycosyltransferase involved in cell wall biosynthesis
VFSIIDTNLNYLFGGKKLKMIKKIINKLKFFLRPYVTFRKKQKLQNILKNIGIKNYTTIIIFENNFGWEGIMKQRPQQIASHFDNKVLFFYHSDQNEYDNKLNYKKIKDNLYLLNLNLYRKVLLKYLEKKNNKFVMIYSTDYVSTKIINDYISNNFKVIYEYVDDIDEKLSGIKGVTKLRKNYDFIINRDNSYVVCTATKLYNNVLRDNPNAKVKLITNGCDYKHFKKKSYDMPLKIKRIKASNKPVIGYYGALASWFDYDLIKKIAALNRYEIILIGIKYDNSFNNSQINKLSNIHYFGKIDYKVLPKYSSFFDVCIIPFEINKITLSTSPVKVFEYMASEKPIVTTDLPECRKYKSVLTSKDHSEFISNLDKALVLSK